MSWCRESSLKFSVGLPHCDIKFDELEAESMKSCKLDGRVSLPKGDFGANGGRWDSCIWATSKCVPINLVEKLEDNALNANLSHSKFYSQIEFISKAAQSWMSSNK